MTPAVGGMRYVHNANCAGMETQGSFDCAQDDNCLDDAGCGINRRGRFAPARSYSPPTVRPSMRTVGAATDPRNSRSLAISEILKNISFRFPATVISSTGKVSSPF